MLAAGTKLGPYEILRLSGPAGWARSIGRATRDSIGTWRSRCCRRRSPDDAAALARFEREAKAVAALSHPNILAVHDFGRSGETTYAVMELLEGESLRERLADGPLPPRKAVEIAREIALRSRGRAREGHRPSRPEAREPFPDEGRPRQDPRLRARAADRVARRGRHAFADGRADHAAGRRARHRRLHGARAAARPSGRSPLGYFFLRRRALRDALRPTRVHGRHGDRDDERDPEGRPAGALAAGPADSGRARADRLALSREETRGEVPVGPGPGVRPLVALERGAGERRRAGAPEGVDVASTPGHRGRGGRRADARVSLGRAHRVRARHAGESRSGDSRSAGGNLLSARFAPDGKTVVYGAAWEGKPAELFSVRTDSVESRPLGIEHADVVSVSSQGELAVKRSIGSYQAPETVATLARVPLGGGAPRDIAENVLSASWTPDGGDLAVIRLPRTETAGSNGRSGTSSSSRSFSPGISRSLRTALASRSPSSAPGPG